MFSLKSSFIGFQNLKCPNVRVPRIKILMILDNCDHCVIENWQEFKTPLGIIYCQRNAEKCQSKKKSMERIKTEFFNDNGIIILHKLWHKKDPGGMCQKWNPHPRKEAVEKGSSSSSCLFATFIQKCHCWLFVPNE
jgi:hypothetical protein